MSWVPKSPIPPYFCGCPGCPMCYDWAHDNEQPIEGWERMGRDLLSKTEFTDAEKAALQAGAQKIHEANLARLEEVAMKDTADQVAYFMLGKRREAERNRPVPKRQKVLDHIDIGAIKAEEDKAKAEKRVKEDAEKRQREYREYAYDYQRMMMRDIERDVLRRRPDALFFWQNPVKAPVTTVQEDSPIVKAQIPEIVQVGAEPPDSAPERHFKRYSKDIDYRR